MPLFYDLVIIHHLLSGGENIFLSLVFHISKGKMHAFDLCTDYDGCTH